ncbi:6-phosphogluconate dehydrogenase, partial [Stagonosporopsis vannaccii]
GRRQPRAPAARAHRLEYARLRKAVAEASYHLTPALDDCEIAPVNSATIIPASVAAATPELFVDKIRPVPPSASFSKNSLVVFLVTPSFAPWLLDDTLFLEKALAKLYKHLPKRPRPLPRLQAVCAVVDRLPEAKAAGDDAGLEAFTHRARHPPVAETGYEGIAYVVLHPKALASAQPNIADHLGCIDFLAHTHTDADGRNYSRVRLPLANTVFQTGEPATLIHSSWEWVRYENSPKEWHRAGDELVRRAQRRRNTAVINLSTAGTKTAPVLLRGLRQEAPVLSIPLLPLTMPRQVDGHMGNIIRGIIGPNDVKMTASTELEQVVPRFFNSRGEPAQATSAWALVIPKDKARAAIEATQQLILDARETDVESPSPDNYKTREQQGFESLWQQQPPLWNVMVQEALTRGARLHKVLSGGGGWGKKAGLLSLDPVPVGPPLREALVKDGGADDYDSVDDFSTALKPVVEDGDFIQFFISAVPAAQGEDATVFRRLKHVEEASEGHPWSWEFGVVPSTVDSIPGGSWQHTGAPSEEMAVFRGTFGALSEGGLTLMQGRALDEKTGMAEENTHTTMVDVPFSRWSAIRLHPRRGVETGSVGDSNKEKTTKLLDRAMKLLEARMVGSNNNAVRADYLKLNLSIPSHDTNNVLAPRRQPETADQARTHTNLEDARTSR